MRIARAHLSADNARCPEAAERAYPVSSYGKMIAELVQQRAIIEASGPCPIIPSEFPAYLDRLARGMVVRNGLTAGGRRFRALDPPSGRIYANDCRRSTVAGALRHSVIPSLPMI
jgi:hypothetical protein